MTQNLTDRRDAIKVEYDELLAQYSEAQQLITQAQPRLVYLEGQMDVLTLLIEGDDVVKSDDNDITAEGADE